MKTAPPQNDVMGLVWVGVAIFVVYEIFGSNTSLQSGASTVGSGFTNWLNGLVNAPSTAASSFGTTAANNIGSVLEEPFTLAGDVLSTISLPGDTTTTFPGITPADNIPAGGGLVIPQANLGTTLGIDPTAGFDSGTITFGPTINSPGSLSLQATPYAAFQ